MGNLIARRSLEGATTEMIKVSGSQSKSRGHLAASAVVHRPQLESSSLWGRFVVQVGQYCLNNCRILNAGDVPTQLIVLTKDNYIRPVFFLDLEQYVTNSLE